MKYTTGVIESRVTRYFVNNLAGFFRSTMCNHTMKVGKENIITKRPWKPVIGASPLCAPTAKGEVSKNYTEAEKVKNVLPLSSHKS